MKLAAANPILAVPTVLLSLATTPVLDTRFVIDKVEPPNPFIPNPNIALSVP